MAIEKFDWNVVVIGYWNPAILTPRGIARRLFALEEGTPVMVEVPMDGLAPHRVRHEGMIVTAEGGRLSIMTEDQTLPELARAKGLATRAIRNLPETPLTAAGYNLRFRVDDPPGALLDATATTLDNSLSDAEFQIAQRTIRRSLEYHDGRLNLEITQTGEAETRVEFNFHRQCSEVDGLCSWLEMADDTIRGDVLRVMREVLHFELDEELL